MCESWGHGSRSPKKKLAIALAVLTSNLVPVASGLRTTGGSPCASVCNKVSTNTTAAEIVCLDNQYDDSKGKSFEDCISCQLQSSYVDRLSGETDVDWGLCKSIARTLRNWRRWLIYMVQDNLRYAFTTCVFGFPQSAANISTPCTVGCGGIQNAVEVDIQNPSANNFNDWCSASGFADNVINDCEFCYNLTYQQTNPQVYMANCAYISCPAALSGGHS